MEPLTLAVGLSKLVPSVMRWFGNDDDAKTADQIIDVAKKVTGVNDSQSAVDLIHDDPELQLEFQQAMQPVIIARYEAETKQLESVNATMRAEYASKRWFIAGWRPFFGYIVALSWFMLMVAIGVVIFTSPKEAPAIIAAIGSLSFMWSIALGVLGVSVHKRSKDKQLAAGQASPPGLLSAIASRIMK
jgi:hypothetical protein